MGIPLEFVIFGLVLLGLAVFHRHSPAISLAGLGAVFALKLSEPGFGLMPHLAAEAGLLANLAGLLLGFAVLAHHFEASRLPRLAPRILPGDWKGPLALLALVFAFSAFLDNIAAALVGGTVAMAAFRGRVHIGYLAAIVGASNAGGAWSVLGDTTTTMMWIAGVPAAQVLHAAIGSGAALLAFGIPASLLQHRHQPIRKDPVAGLKPEGKYLTAVATALAGAVLANLALGFPALGVWAALLSWAPWVGLPRPALFRAARGAVFLGALVLLASLMPVAHLPAASWTTTLALGFVSAAFDNIPLTKLALDQGGYDWGLLAYAVGFGGSMLWFGSSAGVALSGEFPAMRSAGRWLRDGWFIAPAYLIGFFCLLAALGWRPGTLP